MDHVHLMGSGPHLLNGCSNSTTSVTVTPSYSVTATPSSLVSSVTASVIPALTSRVDDDGSSATSIFPPNIMVLVAMVMSLLYQFNYCMS